MQSTSDHPVCGISWSVAAKNDPFQYINGSVENGFAISFGHGGASGFVDVMVSRLANSSSCSNVQFTKWCGYGDRCAPPNVIYLKLVLWFWFMRMGHRPGVDLFSSVKYCTSACFPPCLFLSSDIRAQLYVVKRRDNYIVMR